MEQLAYVFQATQESTGLADYVQRIPSRIPTEILVSAKEVEYLILTHTNVYSLFNAQPILQELFRMVFIGVNVTCSSSLMVTNAYIVLHLPCGIVPLRVVTV